MSFYRRPHCRAIQVVQGRAIKPIVDGTPLPSDFFEARCVGSDGAVHVGLYSGVAAAYPASRCRRDPGRVGLYSGVAAADPASRCCGDPGRVGLYSGVAAAYPASRCRKHSDDDDDDQPPDVLIFGLVILRLYFN